MSNEICLDCGMLWKNHGSSCQPKQIEVEYNQKLIYRQGAKAFLDGKIDSDNPYKAGTKEYYDWNFAYWKELEYWSPEFV